MSEYFKQMFFEKNERYSIIIEDDSRVAYAYLLDGDQIVSDVWLYNQQETPIKVDWSDVSNMPFLNPIFYVLKNIAPIEGDPDVSVKWDENADRGLILLCEVYIRKELTAKLSIGHTPAWSANVTADGPLAKVL